MAYRIRKKQSVTLHWEEVGKWDFFNIICQFATVGMLPRPVTPGGRKGD